MLGLVSATAVLPVVAMEGAKGLDWTAIAAGATALAAIFTGVMAFWTRSLADKTGEMAKQTRIV
jgi:hypothetical protein